MCSSTWAQRLYHGGPSELFAQLSFSAWSLWRGLVAEKLAPRFAEDLAVLASRAPETGVDGRRSMEQVASSTPLSSGLRLVSVPVCMVSKAASAGAADPSRSASVRSRKGLTLSGWSSSLHELGSVGLCLRELELSQRNHRCSVCRTSSNGGVHLPITRVELRGVNFCSVCRTSSSCGVYVSGTSGELHRRQLLQCVPHQLQWWSTSLQHQR